MGVPAAGAGGDRGPRGDHPRRLDRMRPGRNARTQATELEELIQDKLEELDDVQARRKFVETRFKQRMISHLTRAPWLGFAHTAIGVIAISGSVAVSALAAGNKAKSTGVIVIGLVVAAASAASQIFKFAKRSVVRFRAGNELRHEAWDYVLGRGAYAGKGAQAAFDTFYEQIWRIEAPVDASVELEDQPGGR
jgi:hypothetical protein